MHRVVPSVSRFVVHIFRIVSEVCHLLPEVYDYLPLVDSSDYYLPPSDGYSLICDCNTVMYKYESRPPKDGTALICLSVEVSTWRVPRVRGVTSTRKILDSHRCAAC